MYNPTTTINDRRADADRVDEDNRAIDMNQSDTQAPLRTGEFVTLVALLMSLVALATDAMLPALPAIGQDLGVLEANNVQFVVTTLFFGLGIGQLIFGPLSDRIGRKPAIHIGLVIFMMGCVLSIFATTFEVMIVGRVLQGIGAAGPRVVTVALVRDQYEGREMARIMSFTMAVFIFVPTVAPALGQGIQWLADWRTIFITFFAIAAISFIWLARRQPETLPGNQRLAFSARTIGRGVIEVVKTRASLGYTIATGCAFAPFVAYLSTAQQVFQDAYHTGSLFPMYFGMLALAIGLALVLNGRLVMIYGMRRLTNAATICFTLVSVVAWALSFAVEGLLPFWSFMLYLLIVFFCMGLLFSNLNALAMQPLGHIAGVGASVIASLTTLISLPLGALAGLRFDGTMNFLIVAFVVFGVATFAALKWTERGLTVN